MAHKLFHLHRRPTTKTKKSIFYCQFYDEYGNRMTAVSTGQTSRAAAETWAYEQLKKGVIAPEKNLTFEQWVKKEGWWDYERCTYVRSKRARGRVLN